MAIPNEVLTEARKALLAQPTALAVRLMDRLGNEYRVTREEAGATVEPSISASDRTIPGGEPGPVGMPREIAPPPSGVGEPIPADDPSFFARMRQGLTEDLPRGARQAVDTLRVLFGKMTQEEANKRAMEDTAQSEAYKATLTPETARADTARFLGQTAPLLPLGGVTSAAGKLPFLARTAINAVIGAAGAAVMPTEVREGESLVAKKGMQTAGGGVLGAVAEPLIMAGGKVLGAGAKKASDLAGMFSRDRITKEVLDTVVPGLKSAGIDLESMAPEIAEDIFREAAAQRISLGKINMDSLKRIAQAKASGIEITTAQATRDPKLWQLERQAAARASDDALTPAYLKQAQQLGTEATETIPGKLGVEFGRPAARTFEEVEEAFKFQDEAAEKVVSDLFKPYNNSTTPTPMTRLGAEVAEPSLSGERMQQKALAFIEKHKEVPPTLTEMNKFRAELTRAAGKNPTDQYFARRLKNAIMEDMATVTGDDTIRQAVSAAKQRFDLLDDSAAKTILNESANADRYVSSLFSNSRKLAATKDRLLNPISTLAGDTKEQAKAAGQKAWDGIRGKAYTDIIEPAMNFTANGENIAFSGARLKSNMQRFFGTRDLTRIGETPIGKTLFTPQEISLLQNLADLGEITTIAPQGTTLNPSGSGTWVADWAEMALGGKGPTRLASMLRVNPALVRMRGAVAALEESGLAKTFLPFERKAYSATVAEAGPNRVSQALASGSLAPKDVVSDALRTRYGSKAQAYLRLLVPTIYSDVREGARRLGNGESPAR